MDSDGRELKVPRAVSNITAMLIWNPLDEELIDGGSAWNNCRGRHCDRRSQKIPESLILAIRPVREIINP